MARPTLIVLALVILLLPCAGPAARAQGAAPGWRIVLEGSPAPDSALDFTAMAPGWQVTAEEAWLCHARDASSFLLLHGRQPEADHAQPERRDMSRHRPCLPKGNPVR